MKILYHHRTLGDGAEGIHIREMVKAFRDLGHEVQVIGPAGEVTSQSAAKPHFLARVKRSIPSMLFELMEMAYSGYAFLRVTWAIWRFRPDFVYERYITFNAGGVAASRANRVGLLLEVNAPLALERSEQKDEVLRFKHIARSMERWTCTHATRTIVVSTPLKQYLESLGVPPGQCFVMPNGVDPERFVPRAPNVALREQLGIPAEAFVVGFTGVLRAWHGLDLLVGAVADLVRQGMNVALLIVGDGIYRATLEQMVLDLGLQKAVQVTGRVPHDRVPDYISLFDAAVSPRATFYASPMKVIEYMALGKPVVVPRTQNFLDMIDDGSNGITFAEGDVQALGAALAALYRNPDLRRNLGLAARHKVETRLNWKWNALKSCELMQPHSGERT